MKAVLVGLFLFLLFGSSVIAAEDRKVDIYYTTDIRTYRISVDEDTYSMNIPQAPSDLRGDSKLLSIRGLERLKSLESLYIVYFNSVDSNFLSKLKVNLLILYGVGVDDINGIINGKPRGIVFDNCRFLNSNLQIKINSGRKEYLEISHCNLASLPEIEGEIAVMNFSYTRIYEIPSELPLTYKNADRVIILENGLNRMKNVPANFYFEGDDRFLIPYDFRRDRR